MSGYGSVLRIKDAAQNILPVVTGADSSTNLENITDNNEESFGTITKAMTAAGTIGYVDIDLGSIKRVLINATVALWVSSGSIASSTYFYHKKNAGDSWKPYSISNLTYTVPTSEPALTDMLEYPPIIVNARYIRLRFTTNTAGTYDANAKISAFKAHELGV